MMKRRALALCPMLLAGLIAAADSPEASVAGVFDQPLLPLAAADRERFEHGRFMFRREWLVPPSTTDAAGDGLGPLFNQKSCIACHPANGRGYPPESVDERLRGALVRLSVASSGTTVAEPHYGWQFNEYGIAGVPGEGRVVVRFTEQDGLRAPRLEFRDPGYGPLAAGVLTSLRVAPPLYGMGLLELVPDAAILEYADADDADGDGISGRPNLPGDAGGAQAVGRFGWKANTAGLRPQIASAFSEDLGITTPRFPETSCTAAQTACRMAPDGGKPEGTPATHHDLPFYIARVAPPARRNAADPEVRAGEALFRELGCAACHRETLVTGSAGELSAFAGREIHPYSDLLLHDMGPGLADRRPDGAASGPEWRTAPLWGLGLAQQVEPRARFLHDGRARTVAEAVLWHGGEAAGARSRFTQLAAERRAALLRFLESL
jgi:CxxC motif-containing protein (DUF1111 family)